MLHAALEIPHRTCEWVGLFTLKHILVLPFFRKLLSLPTLLVHMNKLNMNFEFLLQ